MTYNELAQAWELSVSNDEHSILSKRTLYNHCQAIFRQFGIEILCKRGRNLNYYYISNPEELDKDNLSGWLIESFSVSSLLSNNKDIADKILLEEIPSGRQYLTLVLTALKQQKTILISYRNFVGHSFENKEAFPLCVKLFKRRWYILVKVLDWERFWILSLDRITDLELTDHNYHYPEDFVAKDYFAPYFGITVMPDCKAEKIVLRAYNRLPKYLESLPLHHSQKIVQRNEAYTDFSIYVAPTFEFIQEILLHGDQIEVIAPISLREKVTQIIKNSLKHYI